MCPMRAMVDSMESNRLSKRARASRAEQRREDEEIKRSSGRDAALNRIGLEGAVRLPANQRGAASLSSLSAEHSLCLDNRQVVPFIH
jgi:hypothetical protein